MMLLIFFDVHVFSLDKADDANHNQSTDESGVGENHILEGYGSFYVLCCERSCYTMYCVYYTLRRICQCTIAPSPHHLFMQPGAKLA